MLQLRLERPDDAAAIDLLLDQVFGPGRFARTAYRLREGVAAIPSLSYVAEDEAVLHGSIRYTPVTVGSSRVLFLGPLVVREEDRGKGIGLALMKETLKVAGKDGAPAVLLVGDLPYYQRVGFEVMPFGQIKPMGPIDPARLLGLAFKPGALTDLKGPLMPLHDAMSV